MEIQIQQICKANKNDGIGAIKSMEGFCYNPITKELTCRVFHINDVAKTFGISTKPKEIHLDTDHIKEQIQKFECKLGQPYNTVKNKYVELMEVSHYFSDINIDHGGFLTVTIRSIDSLESKMPGVPTNWVWLDGLIQRLIQEPRLGNIYAMLRVMPVINDRDNPEVMLGNIPNNDLLRLNIITCDIDSDLKPGVPAK